MRVADPDRATACSEAYAENALSGDAVALPEFETVPLGLETLKSGSLDWEAGQNDESGPSRLVDDIDSIRKVSHDAFVRQECSARGALPCLLNQDNVQLRAVGTQSLCHRGKSLIDIVGPIEPEHRDAPEVRSGDA